MHRRNSETLSLHEAARIVYGVEAPTAEQIRQLAEHLPLPAQKEATTPRRANGLTTTGSIAEYLAEQAFRRQLRARGKPETLPPARNGELWGIPASPASTSRGELCEVYRELLKSYFLAIVFRRRVRRFGNHFRQAVLAGQIGILLLVAAVFAFSIRSLCPPQPPEHDIIEHWIMQQTATFTVTEWYPAMPDGRRGVKIRVKYCYTTPQGKSIDTDRMFTVQNQRVNGVTSN